MDVADGQVANYYYYTSSRLVPIVTNWSCCFVIDATRRRERLRGLLSVIQTKSNIQPEKSRTRSRRATAFAATTSAADNDVSDSGGGKVSPFVSRDRAMSFTSSTSRRSRRSILRKGIVCECCVHRCDLDELQGYCGNSPSD